MRASVAATLGVLVLAGLTCASAGARPATAGAAGPRAAMAASFTPKRLGASTTVRLAIRIAPAQSTVPAAVSLVELGFPSDLGLATSGLGLADCDPAALEREGPSVCPANSKLGDGMATVAVGFGPTTVSEHVTLGLYAAPSDDGFIHLSVLAVGLEPIDARIAMPAVLLPGKLRITVPPVKSLPGAPDVAVLALQATLGGRLTYLEHLHGHTVAYRPRGISLPQHCPHGGWVLSAKLAFEDGSMSRARTSVACPRGGG